MNIGQKTTGMLLNELMTTALKIQHIGEKPEFIKRMLAISSELENRGLIQNKDKTPKFESVDKLWSALADTLVEMWDVVEEITRLRYIEDKNNDDWESLGRAADNSFRLNAERTEYIRRIDKILGEDEFTFLEKSYI